MPREIGIYGKLPAQPDFVRWGAGAFSSAGLDRWLEDGVGALVQQRATLPSTPVHFLLAPPLAQDAFLGTLVASQDAVGRAFPLAVFTRLPATDVQAAFPVLPVLGASFLQAAASLLGQAAGQTAAELASAAEALPTVERPPRQGWLDGVAVLPAPSHLAPTAYAVRTIAAACENVGRSSRAVRSPLIVEVSASSPEARLFWLELVRRTLRWPDGTPSFFWTDGEPGRLLAALGGPPPSLLVDVAVPGRNNPRLWPLRTSVESAATQALSALTPAQRTALEDPRATLGQLLNALGGAP
jgi:type VI secretion system protein ImpM